MCNRQNAVAVNLSAVRAFVRRAQRALRLGKRDFTVCFVDDREIRRLNSTYRGKRRSTDVLSFPWTRSSFGLGPAFGDREFKNYLGDVVISAETARRQARSAGHAIQAEISWLILHGLLHLLGYDHETDDGTMSVLERRLRARLGV